MPNRKQPDSERPETLRPLLAKWLLIFAEQYGKEISPANAIIYQQGLSDFLDEQLEHACTEALKECRFMPTVADIRGKLRDREKVQIDSEAQREWILAWDASGRDSKAELSEAGEHAVRLVGGWGALSSINAVKNEAFLRRDFLAAYGTYHETKRLGIGEGSAKKILDQVKDLRKQLQASGS